MLRRRYLSLPASNCTTLCEAEHLLRRDIVEQSLPLGFAPIVGEEDQPVDEAGEMAGQ